MSDPLTTGSERLAQAIGAEGLYAGPYSSGYQTVEQMKQATRDIVKADPGIVALVAYVVDDDCVCKDLERLAEMAGESPSKKLCGRCAAIKTWETGK